MNDTGPDRNPIAIFGAGGVGLDLGADLVAFNEKVVFLDDNISVKDRVYNIGSMLVGGSEKLDDPRFLRRHDLIVAIGDNAKRREIMERAAANGANLATFIHPYAAVGKLNLKDGLLVLRGASISNGVRIGRGVIINLNASVPHNVVLGDYVNICDGVTLGACEIGDNTFVGLGAVIKTGVKVGKNAFIGMGSVVIYDVPDGARMFGNPARPINERREPNGRLDSDSPAPLSEARGPSVVTLGPFAGGRGSNQ